MAKIAGVRLKSGMAVLRHSAIVFVRIDSASQVTPAAMQRRVCGESVLRSSDKPSFMHPNFVSPHAIFQK
jgi:hypothetical protein